MALLSASAMLATAGVIAGVTAVTAVTAASVSADPLDPVRLSVAAPAIASLDRPVAVSVTVDADAGAFAQTAQDLRLRVRLAPGECASTFAGTSGPVLLDRDIGAVPTSVAAFHGVFAGSGRATAYGIQTVCAFLEEQGDNRLYAADNSMAVDVSRVCTTAGRVRVLDARVLLRSRRALVHARGSSARRAALRRRVRRGVRALAGAKRAERAACAAPVVAGG
jgi:hypothetical protein